MSMKKRLLNGVLPLKRSVIALAMLLFLLPAFCLAQTKTITGVVKDENGNPLPGVSVIVKGTKTGTQTDAAGKFTISVTQGANLVITRTGYQDRQVSIGTQDSYTIALKEKAGELSDVNVVNVGYNTVRRRDLTSSVGSVNMSDVQKAPVTNVIDALAGRVAGVQIATSDGQPGALPNIIIRGVGSLTQSTSPLYVVDGFPLEDASFNSINPDDIESMDVLKDASATAIYGARGANGVIVITTKKGKIGPPIISFTETYGIQKNPKTLQMMNAYQYVDWLHSINPALWDSTYLGNVLNTNGSVRSYIPSSASYKDSATLDWQKALFQTGLFQNNELSIRGGNDQTRYSVSGQYLNQKGIIITSGFKRYQARVVLDQKLGDKFKLGINANYAYTAATGAPIANAGVAGGLSSTNPSPGTLYTARGNSPTSGKYGVYSLESSTDPGDATTINPITDLQNQLRQTLTTNIIANFYAEYAFSKELSFRTTASITKSNTETDAFYNSQTYYGRDTLPGRTNIGNGVSGSMLFNQLTTWANENYFTYNKSFVGLHHITAIAGASFTKTTTQNDGFSTIHIPKDYETMGLDALNLAPTLFNSTTVDYSVIASNSSRNSQASFYGSLQYSYASKYFVTAYYRADGSSKFGAGNKWGYFPAISGAWRLSNENFMKKTKVINDLKIRGGYGETGNNRIGDFAYLPQLAFASSTSFTGYDYGNQPGGTGATISSLGNVGLKWETQVQTNLGLDLSLLKSRIGFTFDWYKKISKNLLLNAPVPLTTGVSSAIMNIGQLQNTGLEFSLNTVNVQTKSFRWTSAFNISFPRNKILALSNGATFLTSGISQTLGQNNTYGTNPYIATVGQPIGQMYGVLFNGLYQYSDFDRLPNGTYKLKPGVPYYVSATTPQPGWAKYKDINGDGQVNTSDYTIIGRGYALHQGGFTNNFSYKGFDISVFLQWSYGNNILNGNRMIYEAPVDNFPAALNMMATEVNRWSPTNQNTNIPVGQGTNYAAFNSRVVEDGSFLRLKTMQVGYTIPASVLHRIKISTIRIFASAQNLHTWTKYSGVDPDVSTSYSVLTPGFDYNAYPTPKTYVLGLTASF